MKNTSAKILAIRAKAGNPNTTCPTCGKRPAAPFRVFSGSRVLYGCVDAIHTGQLVYPSESNRWHHRKEAKELRQKELSSLTH